VAHKDTSFPAIITDALLRSYNIYPVVLGDPPEGFDPSTEKLVDDGDPTWAAEVWTQARIAVPLPPEDFEMLSQNLIEGIKNERDRRLELDFEFEGQMYQRDEKSIARISGAGTLALGAMINGAQEGDLLWHGRETPFAWITSNNLLVEMDAQTCFAFGAAAASVETELVFAAKQLREMDPIPEDYVDDKWWP